jgi:hypothetical protein
MSTQHSPIWSFIWLSLVAVLVTLGSFEWYDVSGRRLLTLLTGLEGTIALACAFAPGTDELSAACQHRGARKVFWWIFEVWQYRTPMSYFPALFYLGLFLLAISVFVSSTTGTP